MESDDAFPNAKLLFQQAFAAEDPSLPLLKLLKEHPTYPALRDLVIYYVETVHEDPYRAQTLASAIARIMYSPDAPSYGQDSLLELLSRELGGTHFRDEYDDDIAKVYGPKNTYLLDSLLSGFSFKYKLTAAPEMYGAIDDGLKARHDGSEDSELLVVGTCIQLLLHGFQLTTDLAGTYSSKPGKVAEKLKAHKKAGTVKDPRAIEVLEVREFFGLVKETRYLNLK
jgi:hypothetical protein